MHDEVIGQAASRGDLDRRAERAIVLQLLRDQTGTAERRLIVERGGGRKISASASRGHRCVFRCALLMRAGFILRLGLYSFSMRCAFCRYRRDDLLVEAHLDGVLLVDRAPMCFGHLLVVSSVHAASVADLPVDARARFLARVEMARATAEAMSGRAAVSIEHGRSPTCGDDSCSCHAHVHVLPVGELDPGVLGMCDFLGATHGPGSGPYLTVDPVAGVRRYFRLTRPVAHAARTLAALATSSRAGAWRPPGDRYLAKATLRQARLTQARAQVVRPPMTKPGASSVRSRDRPIILISGSTGSGKTTVARHLADRLEVPAIELGVILRLASLRGSSQSERKLASMLWRWGQSNRIDFDGIRTHGLAAGVPRLDGESHERLLWTGVDVAYLASVAQSVEVQEVLSAVVLQVARRSGAVIVGRLPLDASGVSTRSLCLDAAPRERARRKRRQLGVIGLGAHDHDWFTPGQSASTDTPRPFELLDTTRLSQPDMAAAALACLRADSPARLLLAA
jgi:cytidylate kinase/diadenosine tetraphosphate (Ap4A) HIT family hydrolase